MDGRLLSAAVLDESALTGEPLPVERRPGTTVRSGVVNAGQPLDLLATARRGRVHLRRCGAPGRAGAGVVGAVRARRRPVRHRFRPAHAGPGRLSRGRSAATRCGRSRCWSSPRRARCCWPRPIAIMSGLSRAAQRRRRHQGRRRAGTARRRAGDAVRQDRHPDPGPARRGRGRDRRRRRRRRRGAAPRRIAGPGVGARAGQRDRHRRHPPRAGPADAQRRHREVHGYGAGGDRRRPPGAARQGVLDRRRRHRRRGCVRCAGGPTWTAR